MNFSLQAQPGRAQDWLDLARRCEEAGFSALLAADHPGSSASPVVALAAAAAVTTTLRLGPYVANAGVRDPFLLATDIATLDVVSGGRALLGIGAGHTPSEWAAVGRDRPDAAGRVRRCVAVAEAVRALLDGQDVDVQSEDLRLRGRLEAPRPVQERLPLVLGTANSTLLRWAGAHADVVGLTGFGKTLADGHSHEVRWRAADLQSQLEQVAVGAGPRDDGPEIEVLVQQVTITNDAGAAVRSVARETGLSEAELLDSPFLLIGTEDEVLAAIEWHERRWGITRYVVRPDALAAVTRLMSRVRQQ